MSARDHLGARSEADETCPPGERYQPLLQPIDWTIWAIAVVTAVALRYLPAWGSGLLFVASGLFFLLRAVPSKSVRRVYIGSGSALVLLGIAIAFGLTGAAR